MTKEDLSITYENNIFYCTKNNTKWISVDGEKWYGEEKRIEELERENAELREKLKTSLDYNKSLLNALKNGCSNRLNGGLIERAENYIKGERK